MEMEVFHHPMFPDPPGRSPGHARGEAAGRSEPGAAGRPDSESPRSGAGQVAGLSVFHVPGRCVRSLCLLMKVLYMSVKATVCRCHVPLLGRQ